MKNMKKVRFLLVLSGLLWACGSLGAQDLIYRINPVQTIEGTVTEIGETYVRYTRTDTRDNVTFSIPVQYIQRIVFSDGKEMVYNDAVDVSNDRRNAIKLSFISPTYNATTLFYERGLKPGQAMEFGIGAIGLGLAEVHEEASGIILKAGYKFTARPERYQSKFQYAHLLKGSYIKPEITFVHYSAVWEFYSLDGGGSSHFFNGPKRTNTLLNFGVVGGKQWVFRNSLLLDLFGGVGLAVGNNENDQGWHYNFVGGTTDFPMTFTLGFKVGFLF